VLIIEHALHYSMILRVYYIFKGVINLSQGEVSIHFNFYELVKEYMDLGEEPANLPIHALNLPQIFWPSLLNIFFLYFLKTKTLTNNKNTKHSSKKQFSPLCKYHNTYSNQKQKIPPLLSQVLGATASTPRMGHFLAYCNSALHDFVNWSQLS
jgi:hypothetical protein